MAKPISLLLVSGSSNSERACTWANYIAPPFSEGGCCAESLKRIGGRDRSALHTLSSQVELWPSKASTITVELGIFAFRVTPPLIFEPNADLVVLIFLLRPTLIKFRILAGA